MRELFLALLSGERAHGYELKQSLEQEFGDLLPALNAGQIYVTLGGSSGMASSSVRRCPGTAAASACTS